MPRARDGPLTAADMPMAISSARSTPGRRSTRPVTRSARPREGTSPDAHRAAAGPPPLGRRWCPRCLHVEPNPTAIPVPLADALSQARNILPSPPLVLQIVHEPARQVHAEAADRPVVQR